MAIATAALANIHRGENTPPYSPSDFMPIYALPEKQVEETPEQRAEQMRNLIGR